MANIGSYTKRNFSPLSQILAYDPSGQVTSLIPGQSLLDYIGLPEFNEALINRVQWFTTNDVAKIEDLPLGRIIYTGGNTTIADGGGGHYVVVETGGSVVLDNGFELLLLPLGDLTGSDATNADVTTSTGSQTVAGALDDRVVLANSIADMKTKNAAVGQIIELASGGRSGTFEVKSGTPPSDPQEGIYIVLANGNYAERIRTNELRSSWFGVVGDYDPNTKIGTDDTVAAQAWFDAISDGDEVIADRWPYLVRASASIKTIQGVSSYVLVAEDKKGISFRGGVYQQHDAATDCVGVAFYNCEDLHLESPIFDGDFRYTLAQPINFKQQLLHLIGNVRMSGSFTVKNSSNVGFLISNQYGDTGSGYISGKNTQSNFSTIISENCLQNTTFGTGARNLSIENLLVLNPITAGFKLSSRISAGAVAGLFERIHIGTLTISFDSTWVLPNKEDDSGPHDTVAGLDNVSSAQDVVVGNLIEDFQNCTITSIGCKQAPQSINDNTRPSGPLHIDYVSIKNQLVANSACFEIDKEAVGTSIGRMECVDISKIVQISDIVTAGVQPKNTKYLHIESLYARGHDRTAINVVGYDADNIVINKLDVEADAGFTQQTVRIDSTSDLNRVSIKAQCNSVVTILGTVNDEIDISGRIDASSQAADPLTVTLAGGTPDTTLDKLHVSGDSDSTRRVTLNAAGNLKIGQFRIDGCPQGGSVVSPTSFSIADQNQVYAGLTVLQPWQFTGTLGTLTGCFSYTGSPNSTQVADIGAQYRRRDTGQLYMKTADDGLATGWAVLT